MGAEISTCCGNEATDNAEVTITPKTAPAAESKEERTAFKSRLEEGMTVLLILQCDRSLDCSIRLDPYTLALVITCELSGHKKVRSILMADVKQILHTKQQLRRVESRAKIESVDRCAALHLVKTGNCIPLFFRNVEDKQYFVHALQEAWQL